MGHTLRGYGSDLNHGVKTKSKHPPTDHALVMLIVILTNGEARGPPNDLRETSVRNVPFLSRDRNGRRYYESGFQAHLDIPSLNWRDVCPAALSELQLSSKSLFPNLISFFRLSL